MQYVAKFINVIGEYYGEIGINRANSTGATDIIVVEQPNGTYKCTPFHARFGKLDILRPKELIVDLYLNNEFVKDLNMRVEPTGQAYFEIQDENSSSSNDSFSRYNAESVCIETQRNFDSMPRTNESFENDAYDIREEHLSNIDVIDPGYRSSDETQFSGQKIFQRSDFNKDVKLSLCGGLNDLSTTSKSSDKFYSQAVTYEEFSKNPYKIINNSDLIVLYNNTFMNWNTFVVTMIARYSYNELISENPAFDHNKPKINFKEGYNKWLRWGFSNNFNEYKVTENSNYATDNLKVNEDNGLVYSSRLRTLSEDILYTEKIQTEQLNMELENVKLKNDKNSGKLSSRSVDDSAVHFPTCGIKKTNILSHEKLKLLKLNEGVNELFYVITGKYRGTIKVGCKVYLWHWSDRIVVSDIDGTITKSDVWGQLAPWLGLDWTQSGIVKLYNSIQKNFFRFVYLSARAIGQADQTRHYLQNVNQQNMFLPDGPLLLAPNSLFIAFKKEVIDKNPEEFKINCLNELKLLFPIKENEHALYAGFGNKPSDELTYETVGIPTSKIFTVNNKGALHNKALVTSFTDSIKTYDSLTHLVNQYFPSKYTELIYSNEFSSFTFWRDIPDRSSNNDLPN